LYQGFLGANEVNILIKKKKKKKFLWTVKLWDDLAQTVWNCGRFGPNRRGPGLAIHIFGRFEIVQKKLSELFSKWFFAISGRFETV
jgi:hypothetical protein